MFAPVGDRVVPGEGFTPKPGDTVTVSSLRLGSLVNRISSSVRITPWEPGVLALMRNLARRALLTDLG
ncbi:hypothetical protein SBA1_1540002 [Candidatus Sulfotelmatobacter kueseliae]|uniref:Fumarylacetoacetase-like C-terminal domain-containing protein n=1 Tax=Candidatus Sulfotelmatobacter kueseliae TaxID=2042962 RepID=A0A2U3KA99_9BACT|nr:hypothetical protein SBA1_1540002 [Candidatus Sulfotelmatobacter kueseliae]